MVFGRHLGWGWRQVRGRSRDKHHLGPNDKKTGRQ